MASIFVSQTVGEPGSSDMWWYPWMVIRIEQDVDSDTIITALRAVDAQTFVDDATGDVDWAALTQEVNNVLSAAGFTVLSIDQAEAVHLAA